MTRRGGFCSRSREVVRRPSYAPRPLLLAFAWQSFVQTIALVVATSVAVVTLISTSGARRRDRKTEQLESVLEAIVAVRQANASTSWGTIEQIRQIATQLEAAYLIATADGTRLGQTEILLRFPTNDDQAKGAQTEVVEAIEALRRSSLRARSDRLLHRA